MSRAGPSRHIVLLAVSALIIPLLVAGVPTLGQSGSLGVTPADVKVSEAQPEQTYERHVTVQNQMDTLTRFSVSLRGDLAAWTTSSPAEQLEVPAFSSAKVTLSFTVGEDAYVGNHTGALSIVADPQDQVEGSGLATKWGVTVPLIVQVGGDPFEQLQWGPAEAPDVEAGTTPQASLGVTNTGNMLTTARAQAEVLAFDEDDVHAMSLGELSMIPGQQRDIVFEFHEALPEGQYRMRITSVTPPEFEAVLVFKVVPPGALGKDGIVRFIEHEPWVETGDPVRIAAVFENTGTAVITRAHFTAEVYHGSRLLGAVSSEPLVVPIGEKVELATFYTPQEPGALQIIGRVSYDGFLTQESESILNVQGAGAAGIHIWLFLILLVAAALAITGAVILRRRQKERQRYHNTRRAPARLQSRRRFKAHDDPRGRKPQTRWDP